MTFLRQLHALYLRGFRWRWDSWPVVLMTLLTGPVLPVGYRIQRWNTCSRWDDEDRWAGTRLFAFTLPLLVYTPLLANLLFFHISLVQLWPGFVFYDPLVWWFVLFPLAPTVALVLERIAPQTKSPQRVLLPTEKAPPPPPPPRPAIPKTPKRSTVIVEAISLPPRRPSSPPTPKKERDPRPIYQAWAVPSEPSPQQPPLPLPSVSEPETPQPQPPSQSTPQQKKIREKPDEGETINDIF